MHDRSPVSPNGLSRALVLAGGGVAGISWMLGLVSGLRRRGLDLAGADLIVGTSAGACVGANLATGALDKAVERQRREETAEVVVEFDFDEYLTRLARAGADAPDPRTALVRMANIEPVAATISEAERRAVIAARLPVQDWPSQRLLTTAVDAEAGELVAFDRDAGVELVDAVAASCALPGVWPATTIAGRRYVDGGARSLTNADLAAGHDVVAIIVPARLTDRVRDRLDEEIPALGAATVHVVAADEASLAAIGPNPLDPARRRAALEAGIAQAETELDSLRAVWGGGS